MLTSQDETYEIFSVACVAKNNTSRILHKILNSAVDAVIIPTVVLIEDILNAPPVDN